MRCTSQSNMRPYTNLHNAFRASEACLGWRVQVVVSCPIILSSLVVRVLASNAGVTSRIEAASFKYFSDEGLTSDSSGSVSRKVTFPKASMAQMMANKPSDSFFWNPRSFMALITCPKSSTSSMLATSVQLLR
eukprot:Lithocolla_globosa_v1_NODE_401_length_4166_cov_3.956458.p3 type:complete len:133 gc:universal NODE_401_length_4166_cov_3.956458:879-481(-)